MHQIKNYNRQGKEEIMALFAIIRGETDRFHIYKSSSKKLDEEELARDSKKIAFAIFKMFVNRTTLSKSAKLSIFDFSCIPCNIYMHFNIDFFDKKPMLVFELRL